MADNTTDILMRVVLNNKPLKSESQIEFTVPTNEDALRTDFETGYCCSVSDFNFSAGAEGALSASAKKREEERAKARQASADAELPSQIKDAALHSGQLQRGMARMALRLKQVQKANRRLEEEAVDMQPVDYTRIVDTSSTKLLDALSKSQTIDQLSIVKRKAAGVANSGLCYLRLDFKQVLLTRLELKDQKQVVHEVGTFIYRQVLIRYRPQLPSGELGESIPGTWVMKPPPDPNKR